MNNMKCPYCIKICTKCKKILVAYNGNFAKQKIGKYGVTSRCKLCDKIYREKNFERISEMKKKCYEEKRDEYLEKNRIYREEHKEEKRIMDKKYYEEHKEEIKERVKKYGKENPHIAFNHQAKRRSKLENQGRGITKEQWYEMMCWFDWCCAYSGEYIGGDSEFRTIDHITPISKDGEHEIWNCVPMYANYNFGKHTSDMEEWYRQQPYFSEERLIKIYAWCEYAYKKWMKERKEKEKEE